MQTFVCENMIKESRDVGPDSETLPITFSICQRLCIIQSSSSRRRIFQILDKVNNIIQVHCPAGGGSWGIPGNS